MAPMGPGTYGSQMGRPPKKKKPKKNAYKKAKPYNPFGKSSGMDPSKASRTTGP